MTEPRPLILTLSMDESSFEYLDTLRKSHFPAKRNFIPAHLTLFHKLSGGEHASIADYLHKLLKNRDTLPLTFSKPVFLGRGVAIQVDCVGLGGLHRKMSQHWHDWLSPQDRQKLRPHITIQNKVDATTARSLFTRLEKTWQPRDGLGRGFTLWRYLDGPWQWLEDFDFPCVTSSDV